MDTVYVRCGDLPAGGKSKNFFSGEYEQGVSVYEAVIRDGEAYLLLPAARDGTCCTMSNVISRPAYIVEGDLIGVGSDGEPLLGNCRIVREVHLHGGTVSAGPYVPPVNPEHKVIRNGWCDGISTFECKCGFKCQSPDSYEVAWLLDKHFERAKR